MAARSTVLASVGRRLAALGRCSRSRSPVSARLLLAAGVTWALHAAELAVFTFTRARVGRDIGVGAVAVELLGASPAIGALLGGPLFGLLADARGRRSALLAAMALSLLGFVVAGTAQGQGQLLAARVLAGVGLGGEAPAAAALIYELAPAASRARAVALLQAAAGVGAVAGVTLAFGAASALGWRALYLALGAGVVLVAPLRLALPESPLWLASVGRGEEALAAVTKLETMTKLQRQQSANEDYTLDVQVVSEPADAHHEASYAPWTALAVLAALWTALSVCGFALGTYVPTLTSLTGFNVFASAYTCSIVFAAEVPGALLAAAMLDRRYRRPYRALSTSTPSLASTTTSSTMNDRKLTIATLSTLTAVFAVVLSYLPWSASGIVVTMVTALVSLFLSGTSAAVLAFSPEHFPVHVRGRGVGMAVACGGAGGVACSFLVYPRMFDVWMMSVPDVAWTFGATFVVIAAVIVPILGLSAARDEDDTEDEEDEKKDSVDIQIAATA